MIEDIEDYFSKGCGRCDRFATADCATRHWAAGLAELRALCLEAGLSETVKWGHPCYMHAGRNIAIIGALRGDFRLSFFQAGLMSDPQGVLERQGPNTQNPDMIRFVSNDAVAPLSTTILAYLREAMDHAEAGRKAPKREHDTDLPEELVDALDADPELAEAFSRLTPGRQRSHLIQLTSAKTSATRIARIAKARAAILAGKGANER